MFKTIYMIFYFIVYSINMKLLIPEASRRPQTITESRSCSTISTTEIDAFIPSLQYFSCFFGAKYLNLPSSLSETVSWIFPGGLTLIFILFG